MWVAPGVRGVGLGGRMLDALEEAAVEAGSSVARLDSNGSLTAALELYRRRGYEEVAPFNDDPFATHWFRKDLGRA